MKVLFVAKDMGGANVALPLAKVCRGKGDDVVVITEGLASAMFEKENFSLYFKGTINFSEEPFTLDAKKVLLKSRPQLIVCGHGGPINLEREFAIAANVLRIPLVAIEDFWNCSIRLEARPDLVLTLDEYAASLAHKAYPRAKIVIVGNPGVSMVGQISCLPEVDKLRERFDTVITYIGAGSWTEEEIDFLLSCLKMTSGNWCIIPRFHPKWETQLHPCGQPYGKIWRQKIEVLGERVVYLDQIKSTDPIAASADITIASFSTLLTTAAAAGKVAISIWLPQAKESLFKQAKLKAVPIVALDCAYSLEQPMPLVFSPPLASARAKLKPYDAQVAYQALSEFLSNC